MPADRSAGGVVGIDGRPFLDLSEVVDADRVAALHPEVLLGLARITPRYTGGSHRSLGIVPPDATDSRPDYGEVIAGLSDPEFLIFASLADPQDPVDPSARHHTTFGEEGDVSLSLAQMRWLELAHDVYFPWKVFVDLTRTTGRWADKSLPAPFTRDAQLYFPRTVQLVQSMLGPLFERIGSVKLLGLMPGDDGTVHRDGDPALETGGEFITLVPGPPKRLFVAGGATGPRFYAPGHAYWFNDCDWHGVEADPWFRYSVRIDGVFTASLREHLRGAP